MTHSPNKIDFIVIRFLFPVFFCESPIAYVNFRKIIIMVSVETVKLFLFPF